MTTYTDCRNDWTERSLIESRSAATTKQAKPQAAILEPKTVKRELFERGWSQARLAKEVGASTTSVNGAILHGLFPDVSAKIKAKLGL